MSPPMSNDLTQSGWELHERTSAGRSSRRIGVHTKIPRSGEIQKPSWLVRLCQFSAAWAWSVLESYDVVGSQLPYIQCVHAHRAARRHELVTATLTAIRGA